MNFIDIKMQGTNIKKKIRYWKRRKWVEIWFSA